jgi:outer membrane protein
MNSLLKNKICILILQISGLILIFSSLTVGLMAREISLDEAIDISLNRTARGNMVRGSYEVAEQNYFARKINFYVPEISVNGSVPAYSVDESFRFFGGATEKQLYKTRDLGFNSFIQLRQNLIIGGDVFITANLVASEDRYPNTKPESVSGSFVNEITRRGFFAFSYTQPLLKPSTSKNELHSTRDAFEIAKMTKVEEETALKKEVAETYMDVLQMSVKLELYASKQESATLKSRIDSLKQIDGVISEEEWLMSSSDRLDTELDNVEIETQADERKRDLALLLDFDVTSELIPLEPEIKEHFMPSDKQRMLAEWETSVPVMKAELEYNKAKREADYKASGHGLTGDLTASYSTGQGNVEIDGTREDINTRGWGVSLNFSYPIWDGGSSGAEVKAARIQAEQAKLEYNREKQKTRAEIINLINQLDVSYRRLEIMKKQVQLAQNRLAIADSRFQDGQVSEIDFLESNIFLLEAKDQYLEELKKYFLNSIDLDGKYFNGR